MHQSYLQIFIVITALAANILTQIISLRCFYTPRPKTAPLQGADRMWPLEYSALGTPGGLHNFGFGLLKSVYLGFAVGLIGIFIFESCVFFNFLNSMGDYIITAGATLIIYVSLGYCYFHFVNLGETARRVRILRELADSKEGLSLEGILERYNAEEIVRRRLGRLSDKVQIIYRNGRYYIGKPVILWVSRFISALKAFLLVKKDDSVNGPEIGGGAYK